MAAGFAATLIAIAIIPVRADGREAAITALAAVAGACAPPLGVVMRTLWITLVDDPRLLQAASSLDGVAESLLNVTGPVIAGVILVVAAPAVGLLATAGLAVAWIQAGLSAGSALGGLGYGAVAWRITARAPASQRVPPAAGTPLKGRRRSRSRSAAREPGPGR